jgi:TetR/AcrR family transcriptional regulator
MVKPDDRTLPRDRRRRAAPPPDRDLDTESRILEAARRVFIRRGTTGARVQEIAAEAGVNQALVHYYFGSKAALAERVFFEAAGRLLHAMSVIADPTATLEQLIERFVVAYIDTVRQTPFLPGYVLTETTQHPERLDALIQRALGAAPGQLAAMARARIDALISANVAAGTMRPITTRQFLVHVMALVVFPFIAKPVLAAVLSGDGSSFDNFLDERRRELPAFILSALRP